jgi:uncharacterized membrane protein
MNEIYPVIRAIHEIAGSLWLGEVVVINFILIPVISKYEGKIRKQVLVSIFPKIFILASILSATVVITGLVMVYYLTNGTFNVFILGKWGISILIGGSLGILLTLFHFFMENRLAKKIGLGKQGDDEKLAEVHLRLKIVPRLGLIVLLTIFLLMINASHGIL